jgi:hypothetical protein
MNRINSFPLPKSSDMPEKGNEENEQFRHIPITRFQASYCNIGFSYAVAANGEQLSEAKDVFVPEAPLLFCISIKILCLAFVPLPWF